MNINPKLSTFCQFHFYRLLSINLPGADLAYCAVTVRGRASWPIKTIWQKLNERLVM